MAALSRSIWRPRSSGPLVAASRPHVSSCCYSARLQHCLSTLLDVASWGRGAQQLRPRSSGCGRLHRVQVDAGKRLLSLWRSSCSSCCCSYCASPNVPRRVDAVAIGFVLGLAAWQRSNVAHRSAGPCLVGLAVSFGVQAGVACRAGTCARIAAWARLQRATPVVVHVACAGRRHVSVASSWLPDSGPTGTARVSRPVHHEMAGAPTGFAAARRACCSRIVYLLVRYPREPVVSSLSLRSPTRSSTQPRHTPGLSASRDTCCSRPGYRCLVAVPLDSPGPEPRASRNRLPLSREDARNQRSHGRGRGRATSGLS